MIAAGIIVEYNPFHNGHYYHIQETKKVTGADVTIAVMSGNFLQRGEPALVSKWARTKMALEGGADIVIELPYVFATQKAEVFAFGAISLLNSLKVDSICFGSEIGKIEPFLQTLKLMNTNIVLFNNYVKQSLQQGKSYPRATAEAFQSLQIGTDTYVDLSQPNNILGFQYIQAIHKIKSCIKPYTIKRTIAQYHDQHFENQKIASATSIRNTLFSETSPLSAIEHVIPKTTNSHLLSYKKQYGIFHNWEQYFDFLKYRLLSLTANELKLIYEVEEGLENRLIQYITTSHSFQDFMQKIKTKRYTWTRLQRLCVHILTNTTKQEMNDIDKNPTYIRLLGTTILGQQYLNKIKKNVSIPIVSRLAAFTHEQINLDIRATKIFSSCLSEPYRSQMIQAEFQTPPIRYDQSKPKFLE